MSAAVQRMDEAVRCLALEVPASVHHDVAVRWQAARAAVRPALFQIGDFTLNSGRKSAWKIECDALTSEDWAGLAAIAVEVLPSFGTVEGVPRGGIPFADALRPYATSGPLLIVDDVLTTGGSMERHRAGRDAFGVVAFARGSALPWVTPLFWMATP